MVEYQQSHLETRLHSTIAARSLQKDSQQASEQNSSMSAFRTPQLRRAKERSRSLAGITDLAMWFSSLLTLEAEEGRDDTLDTPVIYSSKVLEHISHVHRVSSERPCPRNTARGTAPSTSWNATLCTCVVLESVEEGTTSTPCTPSSKCRRYT